MQEGREICQKGQAGDMGLPLGKLLMQKGGNNRGQGVGMSLFRPQYIITVSYTHLTLPTIYSV